MVIKNKQGEFVAIVATISTVNQDAFRECLSDFVIEDTAVGMKKVRSFMNDHLNKVVSTDDASSLFHDVFGTPFPTDLLAQLRDTAVKVGINNDAESIRLSIQMINQRMFPNALFHLHPAAPQLAGVLAASIHGLTMINLGRVVIEAIMKEHEGDES